MQNLAHSFDLFVTTTSNLWKPLPFWYATIEKEILLYQTKSSKFRTLCDLFHRMQAVSGIKRITTNTLLLKETELAERQNEAFHCKWLSTICPENECLNVRLSSLAIPTIGQWKDCLEFKAWNVMTKDKEFYLSQFSKRTRMYWALSVPTGIIEAFMWICELHVIVWSLKSNANYFSENAMLSITWSEQYENTYNNIIYVIFLLMFLVIV